MILFRCLMLNLIILWSSTILSHYFKHRLLWMFVVILSGITAILNFNNFLPQMTSLNYFAPPHGIEFGWKKLPYLSLSLFLFSSLVTAISIYISSSALTAGFICSLLGIYKICITLDWFNLYVGLELLFSGFIYLTSYIKWPRLLQYMKIQILGTTCILLGIIIFYNKTANLQITTTNSACYIIAIGALLKSATFPFLLWADIYDTLPFNLFAWSTILLSKISVYIIILCIKSLSIIELQIVHYLSAFSILLSSIFMVQSENSKKILCFFAAQSSAISIATITANSSLTLYSTNLVSMYIIQYMLSQYMLYFCKSQILQVISILSFSAVPPTFGFFAKFFLLQFLYAQSKYFCCICILIANFYTTVCMEKIYSKLVNTE